MQKSYQTEQRLRWDTEKEAGRKRRRRRDDPEERERHKEHLNTETSVKCTEYGHDKYMGNTFFHTQAQTLSLYALMFPVNTPHTHAHTHTFV